jgi:hypothetical protein
VKRAIALVLLAGLLVTSSEAYAQAVPASVTVSWTAPALQYTDGTPITGGTLYGYELEWQGATSEPWTWFDAMELPPTATSASVPVYCGVYSITIRDVVELPDGSLRPSDTAGPITHDTGQQCPPAPVGNFWSQ